MKILGIESSCDEYSAAIVEDKIILSHVTASQIPIHAKYGGVVPELASRAHVVDMVEVFRQCFERAACSVSDIDGVAVTQGPGLIGSLLVGIEAAKGFAYCHNIPLVGLHHSEGHLLAPLLNTASGTERPDFPFMGLVVSGGHTLLIAVRGVGDYSHVGRSLDDAAGECLDKIGKMLGLPYPGGVSIDKLSEGGDPERYHFPRALPQRTNFDFSFSGLKTSVMTQLKKMGKTPVGQDLQDLCASALEAVVDSLVIKSVRAAKAWDAKCIVLSGGVSANRRLRARLAEACVASNIQLSVPSSELCTDNAAMIASLGEFYLRDLVEKKKGFDAFNLQPLPSWDLFSDSKK
ncbi:MAG: tRNA (adenosine(37)-N6)-threonylcarbamoyltransferase complex transferase subunit TsaD [Bradymonadales bacterium]|jgi:N6-L-threonylcarbamoyladenine synthase